jgi:hypothetical protein
MSVFLCLKNEAAMESSSILLISQDKSRFSFSTVLNVHGRGDLTERMGILKKFEFNSKEVPPTLVPRLSKALEGATAITY